MQPVGELHDAAVSDFFRLAHRKIYSREFFLPVIVVYSVQRGCLIALRGFGEITNPYRILKGRLLVALAGAALMVLSVLYQPLQMASKEAY